MKLDGINEDLQLKILSMTKYLNSSIRNGVYNIYANDATELINKYDKINLMLAGCKIHKAFDKIYVELPYNEITESQTNSILVDAQKLLEDNKND